MRRFACERCGNCCRRPGVVYFSPADVRRAAEYLEMSPRAFRKQYLTREDGRWLLEGADDGCLFYHHEKRACMIQPAKPTQCRAWPFWPETMSDRRRWKAAAEHCPGMGKGPAHAEEEVAYWVEAVEKLTAG
jgi:Fe-S-cluster containining protein